MLPRRGSRDRAPTLEICCAMAPSKQWILASNAQGVRARTGEHRLKHRQRYLGEACGLLPGCQWGDRHQCQRHELQLWRAKGQCVRHRLPFGLRRQERHHRRKASARLADGCRHVERPTHQQGHGGGRRCKGQSNPSAASERTSKKRSATNVVMLRTRPGLCEAATAPSARTPLQSAKLALQQRLTTRRRLSRAQIVLSGSKQGQGPLRPGFENTVPRGLPLSVTLKSPQFWLPNPRLRLESGCLGLGLSWPQQPWASDKLCLRSSILGSFILELAALF